ncbi:tyrosine-type recombinase/integrase, partial [candidate division KSB1 bacterium]|nr:tyrosine-type recombinase/integrase [candidate division KSB1 bacterium]
DDLTRQNIRAFLAQLVRKGYHNTSIARSLSCLRVFAKFLVREEALDVNPTIGIASPRLEKRLPHFITQSEMETILSLPDESSLTGCRDRAVLELFYSTGVRISELVQLKKNHIDWKQDTIRVKGKRNKTRILPLGEVVKADLLVYLKMRASDLSGVESEQDPLFVDDAGRPFARQKLARIVRSYLLRGTRSENAHPHALRHTFATHLLDEGADLMSVKEMLGHSSLSTTQIYTHVSAEHLRQVYRNSHPRARKKED